MSTKKQGRPVGISRAQKLTPRHWAKCVGGSVSAAARLRRRAPFTRLTSTSNNCAQGSALQCGKISPSSPTSSGGTADKAQVVKVIEAVATTTNGHSRREEDFRWSLSAMRVSGAQWHWRVWAFFWPSFNSWQGGILMSSRGMWLRFLCHRSRSCIDKLLFRETCKCLQSESCHYMAILAQGEESAASELRSIRIFYPLTHTWVMD